MIKLKLISLHENAIFETENRVKVETIVLENFKLNNFYFFQNLELGFSKIQDMDNNIYNILILNIEE